MKHISCSGKFVFGRLAVFVKQVLVALFMTKFFLLAIHFTKNFEGLIVEKLHELSNHIMKKGIFYQLRHPNKSSNFVIDGLIFMNQNEGL